MTIVKKLEDILEEKNLSMAELARKTGVPKSNISSWLCGANPNILQLLKVAEFLDVDLEYLLAGKRKIIQEPSLLYRTVVEEGTYEIIVRKMS